MNTKIIENLARIFEILGSKIRLEILKITINEEKCVTLISKKLKLSQPIVSYHLKLLLNAGLVKQSKTAQWVKYSIDKKRLTKFLVDFSKVYGILTHEKNKEVFLNNTLYLS